MKDAFGVEVSKQAPEGKYRGGRMAAAAGIGGVTGTVLAGPVAGLLGAGAGAGASAGWDAKTWKKRKLRLKEKKP